MYNLITLDTALKLRSLGVKQESNFYYYAPWIIVDKDIYESICQGDTKEFAKLKRVKGVGWVVPLKKFKPEAAHIACLPKHYSEKASAFDLSELLRIYGEDIKIPHAVTNYTEYVATQLYENICEVKNIFP